MKYVERVRGIAGNGWCLRPQLNSTTLYSLYNDNQLVAELGGCYINGYNETDGLIKKWRAHGSVDGRIGSMESETILPFGREITLNRNVSLYHGAAVVTVDISGDRIQNLLLDEVTLVGEWSNLAIYDGKDWQEQPLSGEIKIALPVAALTFTAKDGRKFEIGCADDFWRYTATANLGSNPAEMVIAYSENSVVISRKIIDFPDSDTPLPLRPWRFSWYFAWSVAEAENLETIDNVLDINSIKLPNNIYRLNSDNSRSNGCCLMAPAMRKVIRKEVRSCNSSLLINNVTTGFCNDSAHIERPKKSGLTHWDMTELLEFKAWASRQLANKKASFALQFNNENEIKLLAVKSLQNRDAAKIEVMEYEQ